MGVQGKIDTHLTVHASSGLGLSARGSKNCTAATCLGHPTAGCKLFSFLKRHSLTLAYRALQLAIQRNCKSATCPLDNPCCFTLQESRPSTWDAFAACVAQGQQFSTARGGSRQLQGYLLSAWEPPLQVLRSHLLPAWETPLQVLR